jgi:ArsR family transcriptional regulator
MDTFQSRARLLKLVAHPTRLRLLNALAAGEECVCHLTALLNQRQAYVSQQLMFLRRAGLLEDRKEGSRVYYRIKDKRLFPILAAANPAGAGSKSSERGTVAACACPRCQASTRKKRRYPVGSSATLSKDEETQ